MTGLSLTSNICGHILIILVKRHIHPNDPIKDSTEDLESFYFFHFISMAWNEWKQIA